MQLWCFGPTLAWPQAPFPAASPAAFLNFPDAPCKGHPSSHCTLPHGALLSLFGWECPRSSHLCLSNPTCASRPISDPSEF